MTTNQIDIEISDELSRLDGLGLKRGLKLAEGAAAPKVRINGREVILLCSNDYLGLANHPLLKEAAIRAVERYGFGAGGSRLVSGNMVAHEALEERIRRFKGTGAALLFNSGYHANLGVICALADRETDIFSDRLNHASIVDACILSRARVRRYLTGDVSSLESMLKKSRAKKRLIVTDGVFSMDGTIAPIDEIAGLLDRYGATLILDDAHATGVLGENGRGTLERLKVSHPSIVQMGTLGKALGSFGAFIAGSRKLIDLLITKSRPFIYTTALPPAAAAASEKAFDIIEAEPGLRRRLWENVSIMKAGLGELGLDTMNSATQIIPVLVGDNQITASLSNALLEEGVFIQGIRPPTVPENTARLRVTVTAGHSAEDLKYALSAVKKAFEALQG